MAEDRDHRRPADATEPDDYVSGDTAAFGAVQGWIRAELLSRYPVLREECDDLCQTVHGKLLDSLRAGRFEGRSAFRTYVTGIVHFTAIDRLRRRYRTPETVNLDADSTAHRADDPYAAVETRDEIRLLHRVLQRVPESCRELWRLVFVERLHYDRIAEQLGVPTGTVKSRMHHCRRKAREVYHREASPRSRPARHYTEPRRIVGDPPATERGAS